MTHPPAPEGCPHQTRYPIFIGLETHSSPLFLESNWLFRCGIWFVFVTSYDIVSGSERGSNQRQSPHCPVRCYQRATQ